MQSKYTLLIGFGLVLVLTFGVGFKLGQNSEVLKVYTRSSNAQPLNPGVSTASASSNQVAAILLMPKSYVPLLEKFKHRKIARAIKILPAHIGWDDGQMLAIPKKAILKNTAESDSPIVNISHRNQIKAKKDSAEKSKMAQGAALLFLLKGTVKNKLRYVANTPAAHKTGL